MAILIELYTNHGKIICVESSIEYQEPEVYEMQHMDIYFNVNKYSNSRPQYQLLSGEIYLLQTQNCTMKRTEQGFIMMRMQNLKPILLVNILISIVVSQSQLFLLRYIYQSVKLIITVWHKYMSFRLYLQLYVQCNLILFYS